MFNVSGTNSFEEVIKRRIYDTVAQIEGLRSTGDRRILIVDDEATCLMGIRSLLKSLGVDADTLVDVAMSGKEAVNSVEAVLQLGLNYQIIFTDVSMPQMDGLEAS